MGETGKAVRGGGEEVGGPRRRGRRQSEARSKGTTEATSRSDHEGGMSLFPGSCDSSPPYFALYEEYDCSDDEEDEDDDLVARKTRSTVVWMAAGRGRKRPGIGKA